MLLSRRALVLGGVSIAALSAHGAGARTAHLPPWLANCLQTAIAPVPGDWREALHGAGMAPPEALIEAVSGITRPGDGRARLASLVCADHDACRFVTAGALTMSASEARLQALRPATLT